MAALGSGDPGFDQKMHDCDCIPFTALFLAIVFAFSFGVWLTDHLTNKERDECSNLRARAAIAQDRKNYEEAK